MRNQGFFGGCLALVVGVVLLGLGLMAIKWAGIPVGLALAAFCYLQFRRYDTDPEGFDQTADSLSLAPEQLRRAAIGGIAIGVILVALSATLLVMHWNAGRTTSRPSPQPSMSRTPPSRVDDRAEGSSETPAQIRERIERANRHCEGFYIADDAQRSGYNACMRRRGVSASDYDALNQDAAASEAGGRARQMELSAEYCRRNFESNPRLHAECLDNERRLHGW